MPEDEDWAALESELADKKKSPFSGSPQVGQTRLSLVGSTNTSNATALKSSRKPSLQGEKRLALGNRQNEIRVQANSDRNKAISDLEAMESELATMGALAYSILPFSSSTRSWSVEICPVRRVSSAFAWSSDLRIGIPRACISFLDKDIVGLREDFKAVATLFLGGYLLGVFD